MIKVAILAIIFFVPSLSFGGNLYLHASGEHTSNTRVTEKGYGFNALSAELMYRHKQLFIAGGIIYHSESRDCPEVCFGDNYLARVRIGYSFKIW